MKKAKSDIYSDGVQYKKDEVYKDKEVAHLDQNDFVDVPNTKVKKTTKKAEEKK